MLIIDPVEVIINQISDEQNEIIECKNERM